MADRSLWAEYQQNNPEEAVQGLWSGLMSYDKGSSGIGYRLMPMSSNIDDRRGTYSLLDALSSAWSKFSDEPVPWHHATPIFPNANEYRGDISNFSDQLKFGHTLEGMQSRAQNNMIMDLYARGAISDDLTAPITIPSPRSR